MKRSTYMLACLALTVAATTASAQASKSATTPPAKAQTTKPKAAKPKYHRTLPAALMKEAKVTESVAADAAMKAVPGATIEKVVLEKEAGKLIYSYDLKTTGKSGVDEVNVDAMTGAVVSNVHETAADEKAEKSKEAKEKKADTPKTKKPPVTPAPAKKP